MAKPSAEPSVPANHEPTLGSAKQRFIHGIFDRFESVSKHGRAVVCTSCGPLDAIGMMIRHTIVPKTKVALTLDSELLHRVDELVDRRRFRNRSQAIEAALADKLERLARTRLARESAKLDPREEKRLAGEGLAEDFASWPEY